MYIHFMIMLIELQKVLSQEVKCLCSNITTVLSELTVAKTGCESYIFIVFEINKYIYCVEMYIYFIYSRYILYRSVCPLVV